MLEESRLWVCWLQPMCRGIVGLSLLTSWGVWEIPGKGQGNGKILCKSKAQEWGCIFSWCVPLHYIWFEGRMASGQQGGSARGSSGMRKVHEAPEKCWKQVAAPEVEAAHRVHLKEVESHPLAAQRPGALETELSHQVSAVAWGDVRIPQPGLIHFLKATALHHDEHGSKAKKCQQHNFLFLRQELWQFSFISPSRPPGSPDHDILKVNDQHKIFLEARKHGAGISIKKSFTNKLSITIFRKL